jgi:hypothetical protein
MGGPLDPMGKRALFWMPVDAQVTVGHERSGPDEVSQGAKSTLATTGRRRARPAGKHALFSLATPVDELDVAAPAAAAADPMPDRGILTVECSACGAVTRVGLLDFVLLQLPFGVWVPGRTFDHRMRCPACHRRAWTGVTVST